MKTVKALLSQAQSDFDESCRNNGGPALLSPAHGIAEHENVEKPAKHDEMVNMAPDTPSDGSSVLQFHSTTSSF